jgi:mannosyltransferase OCH1-like enzyme
MGVDNNFKFIKNNIRKITEYPLIEIEDQLAIRPPKQKISPIVHQTWIDKKFGRTHAKSIKNFRKLNQNLSFKIYTDQDIKEYMSTYWSNHKIYKIFSNSLIGPLKTDIFRYCILYDQGGYYFDISRGCSIPLTKLHKRTQSYSYL